MLSDLRAHYRGLFRRHGDSPAAVQYGSRDSQVRWFEVLTDVSTGESSVLDVGCGSRTSRSSWLAEATKHEGQARVAFQMLDVAREELPTGFDYVLLSGVLSNRMQENEGFMLHTIRKMFEACGSAIAFNALSTYVDYLYDELYYSDPL